MREPVCFRVRCHFLLLVLVDACAAAMVLGPLIVTIMEEGYQAPMHMCVKAIFCTGNCVGVSLPLRFDLPG